MPEYKYIALDAKGAEIKGRLTANSAEEAAAELRRQKRFVVSIDAGASGQSGPGKKIDLAALVPVKKKDVALMLRQFSVLLESGVSLVQAMVILERQSRNNRALNRLIGRMRRTVESGDGLSDAMAANRRVFPPHMVSLAKSAEVSGEISAIMTRMADLMEAGMDFKRQMITSLIYPVMVVLMALGAVAVLSLVVVPKFIPILNGKGLPWATQVLMDVSGWMQLNWQTILTALAALVIIVPLVRKTSGGGYVSDWIVLRLPVIGHIVQCGLVVDFSRNLATMFASGVSLTQGLGTVRDTLENNVGVRVVDRMLDNVMEGGSMSETLREAENVFPPMVGEMVATGEETGEMERVLLLTADIFQKMLESYVKVMNAMIEPLLIILMGGLVGFVFYALISGVLAVYGI